nr:CapA family protein [uncultured Acetatifactor sp.]
MLIIIMALAGTGAILIILWCTGAFLPGWIAWKDRIICGQQGAYEISLSHRSVKVLYDNTVIWTSPKGVKVQDILSCDADNDGREELILLCWKIGRYGKYRPFWVEKDEKRWSQHIFVYDYNKDEIVPQWMSSYIGGDVAELTSEGERAPYVRLLLEDREGKLSRWVWDSWGFAREDTDVSFAVFGDNLIHEPVYRYGLANGENFDFLFENFREVIAESDVAVINQETPLTDNPVMYGEYPRFGTPAGVGQAIVDAGFDVVTCATNHALDRGAEGVAFTKAYFEERNVVCLGIQSAEEEEAQPYRIFMRNGVRFALFNYTYGTNGIRLPESNPYMVHLLEDEVEIREDIREAKAEADCVIVFAHWGTEDAREPDDFQRKWAEVFLDCGVDVVVGTHPHVLQPAEMLEGADGHEMLIFYSIGNYISAQSEKSCVKGGMASFTISFTSEGYRVSEYALEPLTITWQEGGKYSVSYSP